MNLPDALKPKAVLGYYEKYNGFRSPLDKYFNFEPNANAGNTVSYDILSYSKVMPKPNSRDGEPYATDEAVVKNITYRGITFREKELISPIVLRDMRAPGQDSPSANAQIKRAVNNLALKYEYFKAWLEAGALVGSLTYIAPGTGGDTITETIFDDTTVIDATVTTSWATAAADEATAKSTLDAISKDVATGKNAISAAGMNADTIIMNSSTFQYITTNLLVGGISATEAPIYIEGGMPRVFGLNLDIVDQAYIHPITGSSTKFVADNSVIILDSNNTISGRSMVECEVISTSAPEGTYGFWSGAREVTREPGGIQLTAEATVGPQVAIAQSIYVYSDVTST